MIVADPQILAGVTQRYVAVPHRRQGRPRKASPRDLDSLLARRSRRSNITAEHPCVRCGKPTLNPLCCSMRCVGLHNALSRNGHTVVHWKREWFETMPDVEIARLPEVGLSRERVRQVRARYFPDTSTKQIRADRRAKRPPRWTRKRLHREFKAILNRVGIFRCTGVCHQWKYVDQFPRFARRTGRCTECNRASVRAFYSSERGKQVTREWVAANRDKYNATQKKWRLAHPEKMRANYLRSLERRGLLVEKPCAICGVPTMNLRACSKTCRNEYAGQRRWKEKRPG
jgi:hypothetical protein